MIKVFYHFSNTHRKRQRERKERREIIRRERERKKHRELSIILKMVIAIILITSSRTTLTANCEEKISKILKYTEWDSKTPS